QRPLMSLAVIFHSVIIQETFDVSEAETPRRAYPKRRQAALFDQAIDRPRAYLEPGGYLADGQQDAGTSAGVFLVFHTSWVISCQRARSKAAFRLLRSADRQSERTFESVLPKVDIFRGRPPYFVRLRTARLSVHR